MSSGKGKKSRWLELMVIGLAVATAAIALGIAAVPACKIVAVIAGGLFAASAISYLLAED